MVLSTDPGCLLSCDQIVKILKRHQLIGMNNHPSTGLDEALHAGYVAT